jgi:glycosyltransferase involved in cell wall biosynthesis
MSEIDGVSLIVCCYNSTSRLPETIASLARQVVPAVIKWEVIIVDNASTDQTAEVAYAEATKHGERLPNFRLVREETPGLAFARERGVSEAKYEALIFCDDDNWLCESYVRTAHTFLKLNDKIGAIGGKGTIKSDVAVPDWFDKYSQFFACGSQGEGIEDVSGKRSYVFGAGMVLRKSALLQIKKMLPENLVSDRKSSSLSSAGDVEICLKLRICGWQLWYNDNLQFDHFMPSARLTAEYLLRLSKAISASGIRLNVYTYFLAGKEYTNSIWVRDFLFVVKRICESYVKSALSGTLDDKVILNMNIGALEGLMAQRRRFRADFQRVKRQIN